MLRACSKSSKGQLLEVISKLQTHKTIKTIMRLIKLGTRVTRVKLHGRLPRKQINFRLVEALPRQGKRIHAKGWELEITTRKRERTKDLCKWETFDFISAAKTSCETKQVCYWVLRRRNVQRRIMLLLLSLPSIIQCYEGKVSFSFAFH